MLINLPILTWFSTNKFKAPKSSYRNLKDFVTNGQYHQLTQDGKGFEELLFCIIITALINLVTILVLMGIDQAPPKLTKESQKTLDASVIFAGISLIILMILIVLSPIIMPLFVSDPATKPVTQEITQPINKINSQTVYYQTKDKTIKAKNLPDKYTTKIVNDTKPEQLSTIYHYKIPVLKTKDQKDWHKAQNKTVKPYKQTYQLKLHQKTFDQLTENQQKE